MSFWNDTQNSEPKRNYRFLVQLQGMGSNDVLWYAKASGLPNYTVTNVAHSFLDNEFYFPGRVQWQEITMTLVDPISIGAVRSTNQMLIRSGYSIPGSAPDANSSGAKTLSKNKMSNEVTGGLQGITISVLNADGKAVEVWTLKNPLITSAKFGDLDYTNDELKTIEIGLKYDWAECETFGSDNNGTDFTPTSN